MSFLYTSTVYMVTHLHCMTRRNVKFFSLTLFYTDSGWIATHRLYLGRNYPDRKLREKCDTVQCRRLRDWTIFFCTGASLYAPYNLLLISNKFWMGGGRRWGVGGREVRGPSWRGRIKGVEGWGVEGVPQGPKNSPFPGPKPLPLAHVMYLPASKTLCTGQYKS
jgi:hypothetical protein